MDRRDIERQYATENAWILRHGLKKQPPKGKAARAIQEQIQAENARALEWLQRLEGHGVTVGDWLQDTDGHSAHWLAGQLPGKEHAFLGTREFASIKSPVVGEQAILAAASTSEEGLRPDRCKYVPPKTDDSDRDGEGSEFSPTCKSAVYFDRHPAIGYGKPHFGEIKHWSPRNFRLDTSRPDVLGSGEHEHTHWRLGFWFQGEPDRTADIRRVRSWRLLCCEPLPETKGTICDPTVKSISDGPMGSKWETVSSGLMPRAGNKVGPINHGMVITLRAWIERLFEDDEKLLADTRENRRWKLPARDWPQYSLLWRVAPWWKVPNKAWPVPKIIGPPKRRRLARNHGQFRNAVIKVQPIAPEIEVRRLRACWNEIEALRLENQTVLEIAVRLGISKRTAERKIAAIEAEYETETSVR
jgi:predicted DNA-binding protein (UPF0251 family)